MSHVTLTDVEWINLNVLAVIHAGLQHDRASTCCKFALDTTQADYLRGEMKPGARFDKIKAWISFRTIDAMSLVTGAAHLGAREAASARDSAMALAASGRLYPFVNHAWVDEAAAIHLTQGVAVEYARVSAPWELGSAVWSLSALARRWRGD